MGRWHGRVKVRAVCPTNFAAAEHSAQTVKREGRSRLGRLPRASQVLDSASIYSRYSIDNSFRRSLGPPTSSFKTVINNCDEKGHTDV